MTSLCNILPIASACRWSKSQTKQIDAGAFMNPKMMHEDCVAGKSYLVDIKGKKFEARFKGYPDGDQYNPVFEIRDGLGNVRIIREYEVK